MATVREEETDSRLLNCNVAPAFELKNSPGISYWGYKNLVDFIRFEDKPPQESGYHIRINSLVRTVPITSNPDDEGTISAFKDSSQPEQFHK